MNKFAIIGIDEARNLTRLPLTAGSEVPMGNMTISEAERNSESKVHRKAAEEGIALFRSLGFQIYPDAVGVEGLFTMADFLAVRKNRTIFVEVLSDSNLFNETIERKEKLIDYGELCFICMTGSKISDCDEYTDFKKRLSERYDVLLFDVNPYNGLDLRASEYLTILWDTTRDRGIECEWSVSHARKWREISLRIITRRYDKPYETLISYTFGKEAYIHELIYYDLFNRMMIMFGCDFKRKKCSKNVRIRDMRRKSGLKAVKGSDVLFSVRVEDRWDFKPDEPYMYQHFPPSRDIPVTDFYGIFRLSSSEQEKTLSKVISSLGIKRMDIQQGMSS